MVTVSHRSMPNRQSLNVGLLSQINAKLHEPALKVTYYFIFKKSYLSD